jgi:hypothetical protein
VSCDPGCTHWRIVITKWETWTVSAADGVCCACVRWEIHFLFTCDTAPFFCVCPVYYILHIIYYIVIVWTVWAVLSNLRLISMTTVLQLTNNLPVDNPLEWTPFFTAVIFGCTVIESSHSAGSLMWLLWNWVWMNPLLKTMATTTLLDWQVISITQKLQYVFRVFLWQVDVSLLVLEKVYDWPGHSQVREDPLRRASYFTCLTVSWSKTCRPLKIRQSQSSTLFMT